MHEINTLSATGMYLFWLIFATRKNSLYTMLQYFFFFLCVQAKVFHFDCKYVCFRDSILHTKTEVQLLIRIYNFSIKYTIPELLTMYKVLMTNWFWSHTHTLGIVSQNENISENTCSVSCILGIVNWVDIMFVQVSFQKSHWKGTWESSQAFS